MAHQLDRNPETGVATVFSVRESMWHREGTVLTSAPTMAEAMALAGHNFDVALRPVYHMKPVSNGTDTLPVAIPNVMATVRTDRDEVLGVVGGRYTVLQNKHAFSALDPLLDRGVAKLITGGTVRGGADVWMQVEFDIDHPVVQEVFANQIKPMGLISNNHTGARQVILQMATLRVVCANTLGMAHAGAKLSNAIRVRHTSRVEAETIRAAEQLWGGIIERNITMAEQYRLLRQRYLDEALFRSLVLDVAVPMPDHLDKAGLTKREETSRRNIETLRSRIESLRTDGDGHTGDGSAWEAYNALVQSVDHDTTHWRVRGSRVGSMLHGRLGEVKQRVLDKLVGFALTA